MTSTQRLYYSRPGLAEAEALVLSAEGGALVLDRTIFYPEGGGQPCDLGTIGGIPLEGVELSDGLVLHRLALPPPAGLSVPGPGDRVVLRLDAARRLDHSEQHTGQHLLSAVCSRLYGAETKGFHLGREVSTIDLELGSGAFLGPEELAEAEARAAEAIAEDYPVLVHLCPPEDLASFPLRKGPPEGEEEIRVVEIDGIDYSPCCGTHLPGAGRIRVLKIVGAERRKGMTRVSFLAGGRAVRDYGEALAREREAARLLGAAREELPEAAARAASRLRESLKEAEALRGERAALEAELALRRSGGPASVLAFRFPDRDAAAAELAAKAAAALGRPGLAASAPDLTCVAALPQPGAANAAASSRPAGGAGIGAGAAPGAGAQHGAANASAAGLAALLKPLAAASGGRGGGGAAHFRAVFPDLGALDSFFQAAFERIGGINR